MWAKRSVTLPVALLARRIFFAKIRAVKCCLLLLLVACSYYGERGVLILWAVRKALCEKCFLCNWGARKGNLQPLGGERLKTRKQKVALPIKAVMLNRRSPAPAHRPSILDAHMQPATPLNRRQ